MSNLESMNINNNTNKIVQNNSIDNNKDVFKKQNKVPI